jgi:predicted RNA-binding Zn ribbon-like protein
MGFFWEDRAMGSSAPNPSHQLVVDFANTVACPGCRGGDALASTEDARRWMQRKLLAGRVRVSPREIRALRRFREEVRALLEAAVDRGRPPESALASINRAASRSPTLVALRWTRGQWVTNERPSEDEASRRLTPLVARSAIELLGGPQPTRIRRCEGPGCIHFLVARRSEQRWCSPTGCGNRARVQRHYRKLRARPRTQ